MTAIVNNARFSSNRGGNFQCSFSLILIPAYFTPPQCEWQLLPPMWKGALNFVFFFFPPWNLMWQSSSRARVVTEAHNKGGGFFFSKRSRSRFAKKKKGVKNQNENDICHQRRPALCQPLMRLFPKWACKKTNLHCKLAAHWPFSQVDRRAGGMVPTHTPSVIHSAPPTNAQPPTIPSEKKTSARPSGPNRSHGGGGPAFSQADSPEQTHTVGALFQQQGLGRVRVKGRGPAALTGCK